MKSDKDYIREKGKVFREEKAPDFEIDREFLITVGGEVTARLPRQLCEIYEAIEQSKYILELEDGWDDEGGAGYDQSTWIRATKFLANYAIWTLDQTSQTIDAPKIYPGPDGSIDVLWRKDNYRLLINIPKESHLPASFYGDDFNSEQIKGRRTTEFEVGRFACPSGG